jgi:hypothetical protein
MDRSTMKAGLLVLTSSMIFLGAGCLAEQVDPDAPADDSSAQHVVAAPPESPATTAEAGKENVDQAGQKLQSQFGFGAGLGLPFLGVEIPALVLSRTFPLVGLGGLGGLGFGGLGTGLWW